MYILTSVFPPAPVCAGRPQPGGIAYQVSSFPARRAQSGLSRGVLPDRCPPSHSGVRTPATAGVYCPPPPPQPARGERFVGGVKVQEAAPGTGLCVTGTMAEFHAFSLAKQRLHLEAQPQ